MERRTHPQSTLFVLFGAAGDLSWRLIVPALYRLYIDKHLPERFHLIGVDRRPLAPEELARHYGERLTASGEDVEKDERWAGFCRSLGYISGDLKDPAVYRQLRTLMQAREHERKESCQQVYYMATPPFLFADIACNLGRAQLHRDRERACIVV